MSSRPSKRIDDLAGQRVFQDRVDRKIATPGARLLERHFRIALDDESPMSLAGLSFPPRDRNVEIRCPSCKR